MWLQTYVTGGVVRGVRLTGVGTDIWCVIKCFTMFWIFTIFV